ncbi:MAG: methylated-DNA--[protein]-cysteine S-methyltransferase [Defluviitaleaceae bacterium]|nr:methylated-DNA--[protein]-cysteine S-methyltransferase [Defluviitaleaceae bacterium]
MKNHDYMVTPIGWLKIEDEDGYITQIHVADKSGDLAPGASSKVIEQCKRELSEYFAGTRTEFTVPMKPVGTPFRQQVWEELKRIKYGEVISYKELAARIGNPKAMRAVGGANAKNPLMLLIPCHRVIGADGTMTGYGGGGTGNKEWLLNLEKRNG